MEPETLSAVASEAAENTMDRGEVIAKSFELMGKGLVGIFVTIIIIMICVFVLMRLSKGESKTKTEDKQ